MRLLSWNLRFGHGSRSWPPLAEALQADVIFLQEVAEPALTRGKATWESVPGRSWGSAVVVSRGQVDQMPIPGYEGWVVGGAWSDASANELRYIFSVHAPTSSEDAKRRSYVREVRSIVEAIHNAVPKNATVWIGGDFNFTSLGERLETESLKTKPEERSALQYFKSVGLVPLWHALHPERPLPQTIRWSGDKALPYHCDGFLLPERMVDRAVCEVLEAPVLTKASDHSPVAAWIV